MRTALITLCLLLTTAVAMAQEEHGPQQKGSFDPKVFETQLEQYVIAKAGITKAEEEKFLPIYREMRSKQVQLMADERKNKEKKPTTEAECEAAIKAHDKAEIELKKVIQTYHEKLLKVIPASKLVKVIQAETDFHRDTFRQHMGAKPPARPRK